MSLCCTPAASQSSSAAPCKHGLIQSQCLCTYLEPHPSWHTSCCNHNNDNVAIITVTMKKKCCENHCRCCRHPYYDYQHCCYFLLFTLTVTTVIQTPDSIHMSSWTAKHLSLQGTLAWSIVFLMCYTCSDIQPDIQPDRQRDTQRQTDRRDRQSNGQAGRQTVRQTVKRTSRQADEQLGRSGKSLLSELQGLLRKGSPLVCATEVLDSHADR